MLTDCIASRRLRNVFQIQQLIKSPGSAKVSSTYTYTHIYTYTAHTLRQPASSQQMTFRSRVRSPSSTLRLHAGKYFLNPVVNQKPKSSIVFYHFLWFIWNQTEFRLIQSQSENDKYNLILVWFNKIQKRFLGVHCSSCDYYVRAEQLFQVFF